MALAPGPGRLGNFKVGAGDTAVLGVRSVRLPKNWNTEKVMHLQDTSPTTLLNYQEWTVTVELTMDLTDTGQSAIRSAHDNGTELEFKGYVDATHYYHGHAYVTRFEPNVDASRVNTLTVTFEPYLGSTLTYT